METPAMFCYQCQETARGKGCEMVGVCGKHAETSARMDLLLYGVRGVAAIYNPQNETCDALRTKRAKIKTKRFSVSKRSVPLRCFQGYPNSARIRQGLGLPYNPQNEI